MDSELSLDTATYDGTTAEAANEGFHVHETNK